jgi:epoxyqueuosine reductase QueG
MELESTVKMKGRLIEMGADVVGIADMTGFGGEILGVGPTDRYIRAISFGLLVPEGVLETLDDGPTLFYLHHYRQVNYRLDTIAYLLAKEIEAAGHHALPFAASQMIDWQRQLGHISHKHTAQAAGLGWIGRNNLLVHPQFGSRLRYNTVLTDMQLEADAPLDPGCGECTVCISSCPAGAIKQEQTDFDHRGCYEMLTVFKNKRNIGHHICGLCVKACKGKNRGTRDDRPSG